MPEIIDISAPEGYEVAETTEAKDLVMDLVQDAIDHWLWYGGMEEPDDYEKAGGQDAISVADRIVESLIEKGWRPTE